MIEILPNVVVSWLTPDYAHPETKSPALPIIVFVFYTLRWLWSRKTNMIVEEVNPPSISSVAFLSSSVLATPVSFHLFGDRH
ncbi:unnamed protein product [Penicillium discolor]